MAGWVYSSYHSFMMEKATRIRKERTLGFFGRKEGFGIATKNWTID